MDVKSDLSPLILLDQLYLEAPWLAGVVVQTEGLLNSAVFKDRLGDETMKWEDPHTPGHFVNDWILHNNLLLLLLNHFQPLLFLYLLDLLGLLLLFMRNDRHFDGPIPNNDQQLILIINLGRRLEANGDYDGHAGRDVPGLLLGVLDFEDDKLFNFQRSYFYSLNMLRYIH